MASESRDSLGAFQNPRAKFDNFQALGHSTYLFQFNLSQNFQNDSLNIFA